jgi:hypothetical protein
LTKSLTPRKLKISREPSPETPCKDINDLRLSSLILPEFRALTEQNFNSAIPVKKRKNQQKLLVNTSTKELQSSISKESKLAFDIFNLKSKLNAQEKPSEMVVQRRKKLISELMKHKNLEIKVDINVDSD